MLTANLLVLWNLVQTLVHRMAFLGPLSGFVSGLLFAWAGSFGTVEKHTVPALQNSFWLTSHVFLCMLAYVAVFIATVAALFLLMRRGQRSRMAATFTFSALAAGTLSVVVVQLLQFGGIVAFESVSESGMYSVAGAFVGGSLIMPLFYYGFSRLGLYGSSSRDTMLERFVHTTALIGLALITLGIITGSVWGDLAWGRYWGWDPKEVWALLTWFALLIYIHLRSCGKRGFDLAPWAIVIGLITVVFNYFGVNFVLTGLHTYAG
ncbi:MAG: cytochrome c biogenesis protein CcsA [Planctomycetota bacterium]|nr:cytochrome c biogenesis protein CcsA [Planctomycetota bacterium]